MAYSIGLFFFLFVCIEEHFSNEELKEGEDHEDIESFFHTYDMYANSD